MIRTNNPKYFYLASALKNANLNRRIADAITMLGARCYLPQDDPVNHSSEVDGNAIATQNRTQIESCDVLIALFHQMGLDTSWEIGFAHGLGKPCLLMCTHAAAAEAQTNAMPFYSVAKVVSVPSWDLPTKTFADTINQAVSGLSIPVLPQNPIQPTR